MDWNDWSNDEDEGVSKEDIQNAEAGGGVPPGKYLCILEKTTLKDKTRDNAPLRAVECLFKVVQALEVEGVAGDHPEMAGKKVVDTIDLYLKGEKEAFKNRRVMFLRRIGAIKEEGDRVTGETWSKAILGRRILVKVERRKYKDKKTNEDKEAVGVGFFSGYDYADKTQDAAATQDYSDI